MAVKEIEVVKAFIATINEKKTCGAFRFNNGRSNLYRFSRRLRFRVEEMTASREGYYRMFPDYQIYFETILADNALVAVFGSACGTYNGRRGLVLENRIEMPAAWKAVVENSKIKSWQVYADWSEGIKIIKDDKRLPIPKY